MLDSRHGMVNLLFKLHVTPDRNCTTIIADTYTFETTPSLSANLSADVAARVRYVALNLFCRFQTQCLNTRFTIPLTRTYLEMTTNVHAYFYDCYHATNDAAQQAALSVIRGLVDLVDPEKKASVLLSAVTSPLSAGLSLIPEVGSLTSNALITVLQQVPGVLTATWPAHGSEIVSCRLPTRSAELLSSCSMPLYIASLFW